MHYLTVKYFRINFPYDLTTSQKYCIIQANKEKVMAKPQQTASELSRTLAGQWTKSEKRAAASRSIMNAKKNAHEKIKAFKQSQILAR
jgi:hypothetical protein